MENTITEHDMDGTSRQFVQAMRGDEIAVENDLDVDGLSESLLSRLLGLFSALRR